MKKMMLLVGLLCVYGLNYAATSDTFNVHAKVIEPVAIEVIGESVEFDELIPGTSNQSNKEGVTIKISGEEGKRVALSYEIDGEKLKYGQVDLISESSPEAATLDVVLYKNENRGQLLQDENFVLEKDGKQFEVNGYIRNGVPSDAVRGDYYSKNITVKVQYE